MADWIEDILAAFAPVVIAVIAVIAIALFVTWIDSDNAARFKSHCATLGGHVKHVDGYKDSTDFCITDRGVVDVR